MTEDQLNSLIDFIKAEAQSASDESAWPSDSNWEERELRRAFNFHQFRDHSGPRQTEEEMKL